MAKPTDLPVWDENQLNITAPGVTQQLGGWQTTNGNIQKPPYQWINYLYNLYYRWIDEFNKQGIVEWDATTEYDNGDLTKGSDGYLYQSRIDNNVGNDPTTPSPTQWKLGLINPTLVIGADAEIGTDLQLQVVDAVEPIIELSVGQGSLRQRLTFGVDSTDATIQSFDESGPNPIPLNLNPDGGDVTANGMEVILPITSGTSVGPAIIPADPGETSGTVDMGAVEVGDIVFFNYVANINKTAAGGEYFKGWVQNDLSSTATISTLIGSEVEDDRFVEGAVDVRVSFSGIIRVTGAGNLVLQYIAQMSVNGTGAASEFGVRAQFIRKSA
jgi:hypothetical protein